MWCVHVCLLLNLDGRTNGLTDGRMHASRGHHLPLIKDELKARAGAQSDSHLPVKDGSEAG